MQDFSGTVKTSGSKSISNIQQTTMFSIMCAKGDDSAFDYVTVLVSDQVVDNTTPTTITSNPTTSNTTVNNGTGPSNSGSSSTTRTTKVAGPTPTTKPLIDESYFEELVKNPANMDCEVLPVDIARNDPVKISIINVPNAIRKVFEYNDYYASSPYKGRIIGY